MITIIYYYIFFIGIATTAIFKSDCSMRARHAGHSFNRED